ncbi:hypothetical protein, partial [Pseudomonas brenneri]|uniref:hypothetical protein n=1 Tax=Pseudomonas brenneri TaxID=129817 RepID=UPI0028D390A6
GGFGISVWMKIKGGSPHYLFDVALSRSKLGAPTKYQLLEVIFNPLKSVAYFMFDKSGLARESGVSVKYQPTDLPSSRASPLPHKPTPTFWVGRYLAW